MGSRRKSRECAVQMLFQWEVGKDSPEQVLDLFWSNTKPSSDDPLRDFADALFLGTVAVADQIDRLIREHSEHWRLERMAKVDLNILRLGIYELAFDRQAPPAVVINEALEIARKFGGEESVEFINGLLDRIRKETESVHPA